MTDPELLFRALDRTSSGLLLCLLHGESSRQKVYERLRSPSPGDYVVIGMAFSNGPERFGRLVHAIRGPGDDVWLIEHQDGSSTWWSNCEPRMVVTHSLFDEIPINDAETDVKIAKRAWAADAQLRYREEIEKRVAMMSRPTDD